MYLRHTTRRKDGKRHVYWQLVQSVRVNGKVVQKILSQLGELDADGRARAHALALRLTGYTHEQTELFEDPSRNDLTIPVSLKDVRLERLQTFGDVWLAWRLWQTLGLDALCRDVLPEGREDVPWATMAAILVFARLCEPSSELHIAEAWYRKTALADLLGVSPDRVNEDRLYRALDQLRPHKVRLEQHLRERLGTLFQLKYDLLLYDLTSTYFEGRAEANPLAAHGYSRDHRSDCKQIVIALVVTRDGMPLGYEVFPGNRADATTLREIVETMESRFGMTQRVWVMDRGLVSAAHLTWLQQTGRRYLVGTPRSELRKWDRPLADARDWQTIREGVEVKGCVGPGGEETFVLVRSADRRKKERAMHERFAQRIEDSLQRLACRLTRAKKPADRDRLQRQLGRLLTRNSRAAGRYEIALDSDPTASAGVRLRWTIRTTWDEWARLSEGCYVLRTNETTWTAPELWATYMHLTDVEAAFRIQKDPLGLRPIWHQKAERVEAHLLVCFLAYVLWKTLEQWQQLAGLGHSPRTILDELKAIQSADIVLPVAGAPGREVRIRCVVRPNPAQAALLDRLGLRLPQRLRPLPGLPAQNVVATLRG